ncbi:MAG: D-cysteine desulfhydrase [Actinomycetota bacterium]|jgi:D-cysteine desulfhydrase|nr:D-cysteine desulfhydrase [Actinomycetota bacterium]
MTVGPALERRIPLVTLPTPFEPAPLLGAALGLAPGMLWVKRDDVTGLGGGGNKARKLEYLCADAVARGCDVLVTGGGQQSNHVRMTAAAACRLGLGCVVVVPGAPPAVATGNVVLDELFGPEFVRVGDGEQLDYYAIEAAILAAADRLTVEGRRPYAIPVGGASPVGALGYVTAAAELLRQAVEATGAEPDVVVVADGSGGTHAGLAVGIGDHHRILGVDVGARPDVAEVLPAKAAEVAALTGRREPAGAPVVDRDQVGRHYADLTDACRDAIVLAARTEGLLLDPVYTGKAMAGLIAARADGRIGPESFTVFLHTGGSPALFMAGVGEWLRVKTVPAPRGTLDRTH